MLRYLALFLVLFAGVARADGARSPFGLWLTADRGAVVAVTACGTLLCAQVRGYDLQPGEDLPPDYRGQRRCGLTLINDAANTAPDTWAGHITDPRSNSRYVMTLHLTPDDRLALHGYLVLPLLGQTQYWTRYNGPPMVNCRFPH